MNMGSIIKISKVEISKIMVTPLVIFTMLLLASFSLVNLAGFMVFLPNMGEYYSYKEIFFVNVGNFLNFTTAIFTFLSVSLVIINFAEERSRGSLGLLTTKPVYRIDIIAGKFLGINILITLVTFLILLLFISLLILYGGMPTPEVDVFARILTLIILLCCNNWITVGVTMLVVLVFKRFIESMVIALIYVIFEWLTWSPFILNISDFYKTVNPAGLFVLICNVNPRLLDTTFPYEQWLGSALPYLFLLILELILLFVISSYIFSREEL